MAKLLTSLAVAHAKPYRRDGIAVLSEIRDGGCRGLRLLVYPTGPRRRDVTAPSNARGAAASQ
jgi:hypothetical protein